MSQSAVRFEDEYEVVLRRYLRALASVERHPGAAPSPGTQVRTCPTCGERTIFRLEPGGTWYRCGSCGRYA